MAANHKLRRSIPRAAERAVAAIAKGACRVLVVESDPDLQWRVARVLSEQGHRVVGTSSGDGAMALMAQWPVELVLVDETQQSALGVELAERMREHYPDVPVVVMTEEEPPSAGLGAAATWVEKPLQFDALLSALTRAGEPAE